jgi:superfamily II DNA or RNA helicase
MSVQIDIDSLSDTQKDSITKDLTIRLEASKYAFNQLPTFMYPYHTDADNVYIPFSYAVEHGFERRALTDFSVSKIKFKGHLRPEQKKVKSEVIGHLNEHGCSLISAYCGFGKTVLGTYLACKISVKRLIITHRIVLINQWKKAFNTFVPHAGVQIITPKTTSLRKDCDVFIMNAINVPKMSIEFFDDIGMVIVDEVHRIVSGTLSKSFLKVRPRYMIALSATPYRKDGFDALINMYFGTWNIFSPLNRKHLVYKVQTSFKPEDVPAKNGRTDWSKLINSQSANQQRNEMIIRIAMSFPDRVFLIVCKRVEQARYIFDRLQEENEAVASLIGSEQEFIPGSRILVGSIQKIAEGFDHRSKSVV